MILTDLLALQVAGTSVEGLIVAGGILLIGGYIFTEVAKYLQKK